MIRRTQGQGPGADRGAVDAYAGLAARGRATGRIALGCAGALLAALFLTASLTACQPAEVNDPLALRCGEVAEYHLSDWSELRVTQARRTGGGLAVTLRVEGVVEPQREKATEFISCAFQDGARPSALRVVVGDRQLDAKELALVNAELLLRDLGRGAV